jgi:hypothetical protein
MSMVRIFFAWLVIAALPLQGWAAASMQFCDQAGPAAVQPSEHGQAGHHDADARLGHGMPHGEHGHVHSAGPDEDPAPLENVQAGDSSPQGKHACPICATCCSLVALPEHEALILTSELPSTEPPQSSVRILLRAPPRPDKPPRA